MRASTAKPALFAVLVVLVGVTALFAATPEAVADEHEDDDNQTYTSEVMYWSLDAEGGEEDADYGVWEAMSRDYDRTWVDPISAPEQWNDENARNFGGGGLDKSVHPESADLHDSGRIKDAYIEVHSVTPMTIVHLGDYRGVGDAFANEQSTYNYIRPDSHVNVIWDYRVNAPNTGTTSAKPPDGSDPDHEDDTYTVRRVEEHGIEEIRMEYDDDTYSVKNSIGGHSTTLRPGDSPHEHDEFPTHGNAKTITVTAEITSSVNVTKWKQTEYCDPCHNHDKDPDGGECEGYVEGPTGNRTCIDHECSPCHNHDKTYHEEWSKQSSHWENDTVTVKDRSRGVIGYYAGAIVNYASMPDGSTQYEIYQYGSSASPVWDGADLPDGTEANTLFRYYTTRDTSWDVMQESTDDGTDTIRSEEQAQPRAHWYDYSQVRPMELHAYPSSTGTFVGTSGTHTEPVYTSSFGTRGQPHLHENLTVSVVSGEYAVVNHLVAENRGSYDLTYDEEDESLDELTVKGIVPGSTADIVREPKKVDVKKPGFETEVENVNREASTVTYTIQAVAPDGTPINTEARDGAYITINGDEYQTGPNGEVTITVNYEDRDKLYLEYYSVPWYEYLNTDDANSDKRFVDNTEIADVSPAYHDNVTLIYKLLYLGVVPWIPFLLIIWMFDRILDLGIWPPWKRFF